MTLKLHPTGFLRSDQQDQAVRSGDWQIGRIWEDYNGREDLRWRWSHAPITGPRAISRLSCGDIDKAKEQFTDSWSKLLARAGLKSGVTKAEDYRLRAAASGYAGRSNVPPGVAPQFQHFTRQLEMPLLRPGWGAVRNLCEPLFLPVLGSTD
jgi:hypothetical protein